MYEQKHKKQTLVNRSNFGGTIVELNPLRFIQYCITVFVIFLMKKCDILRLKQSKKPHPTFFSLN